jgi:hypothetical protein
MDFGNSRENTALGTSWECLAAPWRGMPRDGVVIYD